MVRFYDINMMRDKQERYSLRTVVKYWSVYRCRAENYSLRKTIVQAFAEE